jgi:hypothetical protein
MKVLISILVVVMTVPSAFAGTVSFSKDFIASTLLSVDNEPGKKITIRPFETFSNIIYGRDGINASPRFHLVFIHPGIDYSGGYVRIDPEELKIIWEGSCEYGAKVFTGEMVSYEQLRVVMNNNSGKVSIHGVGQVVGECN